jgi:hypothetical protein
MVVRRAPEWRIQEDDVMSRKPIEHVGANGGKRKRRPSARFFDWRTSDPANFAGAEGLADELTTYKEHLDELLRREGDFVLIKGRQVIGIYSDREQALQAALDRSQDHPFLVKRIVAKEPIHTTGGVLS